MAVGHTFLCEDSPLVFVFFRLIIDYRFRMPPIAHNVRGSNATYELTSNVMGIIQKGLEAHDLANVEED
jgi:hypothetical protein